ncbi:hypothetical protein KQX54_003544 [Cotesia glomerata]|uniref:Uncharacterized protein n=1 Tax=Cotesia glomerata TaxID=32391 RepID=A0AAV7HVA0_COTGL|nr:hypothetical protein KQX54_003544 [Cotesia glomerata]
MATTSILALLVALSALAIYSNGMPQYGPTGYGPTGYGPTGYGPGSLPPGFDGRGHGWSHTDRWSNHNVTHDDGKTQIKLWGIHLGDINSEHTITTDGNASHYQEHRTWK